MKFITHLCNVTTTHLQRGLSMSAVDEILSLLKDGDWHNLNEITKKSKPPPSQAELIVNFLAEYNFVELKQGNKQVRLQSLLVEFFNEIQRLEKEELNK